MVHRCDHRDLQQICEVINDGAQAYKGVIPPDRWSEPYMPLEKLQHEIDQGVVFWAYEDSGHPVAVMGIQELQDVTLIRHAYVRTGSQKRGLGSLLLSHLRGLATRPILIGTWADALWAIHFYQRHGFACVTPQQKELLLRKYWVIPERQIETSVVLADAMWRAQP